MFQTFPGVLRKGLRVGKICHLATFHETNYHEEVMKIYMEGLAANFNQFRSQLTEFCQILIISGASPPT
jgi:hypothetical protein